VRDRLEEESPISQFLSSEKFVGLVIRFARGGLILQSDRSDECPLPATRVAEGTSEREIRASGKNDAEARNDGIVQMQIHSSRLSRRKFSVRELPVDALCELDKTCEISGAIFE
jgi:hypothetical protein